MAKYIPDSLLNDFLTACRGTRYYVTNAVPTSPAEVGTFRLNDTPATPSYGAIADGAIDGRSQVENGQTGIAVDNAGTANNVAITDGSDNPLVVTEVSNPQALTTSATIDTASFTQTIRDVT